MRRTKAPAVVVQMSPFTGAVGAVPCITRKDATPVVDAPRARLVVDDDVVPIPDGDKLVSVPPVTVLPVKVRAVGSESVTAPVGAEAVISLAVPVMDVTATDVSKEVVPFPKTTVVFKPSSNGTSLLFLRLL